MGFPNLIREIVEIITGPDGGACMEIHIRPTETSHLARLHASYTAQIAEKGLGQYEIK
jgi:hypothetical protein